MGIVIVSKMQTMSEIACQMAIESSISMQVEFQYGVYLYF